MASPLPASELGSADAGPPNTIDLTDAALDPEAESGPDPASRSGLSRRGFLMRSSLTVAAAGVASSLPALPSIAASAENEAPEAESVVGEGEALSGPLIAHIKDLQTGAMTLFSGESEFNVRDPALAARIFRAAQ